MSIDQSKYSNKKILISLALFSAIIGCVFISIIFFKNILFTFSNFWGYFSWIWIIFSVMMLLFVLVFLIRFAYVERLVTILKLPQKYAFYLVYVIFIYFIISVISVIVFVPAVSSLNNTSTVNSANISQTYKKWKIISDDGKITGIAKTTNISSSSIVIGFVIFLQDNLINNGKCIDQEGTYCQESIANKNWEEKRYYYGLLYSNTVNDSYPAGSEVQPVYCNKDAVMSNPEDMMYGSGKMTDINCNTNAYNWKPTDTLLMQNATSVKSIDNFLSNYTELTLFDTASMHKMISHSSATDYSVTGTSVSTKEMSGGNQLKTYKVKYKEI